MAKRGRKEIFREGDTVYWTCMEGVVRSGQIMKLSPPFIIVLVPGAQRRWVRMDVVSKKKI
jgi:hypothetical protein